jgi:hypothetical protein
VTHQDPQKDLPPDAPSPTVRQTLKDAGPAPSSDARPLAPLTPRPAGS